MNRIQISKLFIQPTNTCLSLLKYINKNIDNINSMGIAIQIEKLGEDDLDEETAAVFKKKGITRMPALLTQDGTVFLGIDQITGAFSRGLKNIRVNNMTSINSECDVEDYMRSEITRGVKVTGRGPNQKVEMDDEDDNRNNDVATMMDEMNKLNRRRPGNRGTDDGENDFDPDDAANMARRRMSSTPNGPRVGASAYDQDNRRDNIMHDDDGGGRFQAGRGQTGGGVDDFDENMLAAYMQGAIGGGSN